MVLRWIYLDPSKKKIRFLHLLFLKTVYNSTPNDTLRIGSQIVHHQLFIHNGNKIPVQITVQD